MRLLQVDMSRGHNDVGVGDVWPLLWSQAPTGCWKLHRLEAGLGREKGVVEANKCGCKSCCSFSGPSEVFLPCCHPYVERALCFSFM